MRFSRFFELVIYGKAFTLAFLYVVFLGSGEGAIVAVAYVLPTLVAMIVADAGWARGNRN